MIIVLPNHVNEYQNSIIIANTDLRVSSFSQNQAEIFGGVRRGFGCAVVTFGTRRYIWVGPPTLILTTYHRGKPGRRGIRRERSLPHLLRQRPEGVLKGKLTGVLVPDPRRRPGETETSSRARRGQDAGPGRTEGRPGYPGPAPSSPSSPFSGSSSTSVTTGG